MTLLSILIDLDSAVVWMVSLFPLISCSLSLFSYTYQFVSEEAYNQTHTQTHTHIYIYIYIYIPTPLYVEDMKQGWFLIGLNLEFSVSYTGCRKKGKKPSLPFYLLIVGRRTVVVMLFPRVLVLRDMEAVQDLNLVYRVNFLRQ